MANTEVNQRRTTAIRMEGVFTELKFLKQELGKRFIIEQRTLANDYVKLSQIAFDRGDLGKARIWAEEALDIAKNNPNGKAWVKNKAKV
jgi:hypothetical protein